MDYFKIYCDLINKRLQEPAFIDETGLGEIHHIIPRKLENNNIIIDLFNNYNIGQLVNLTYREHYIAHKLLVSVFKKDVKKYKDIYYKMVYAFNILTNDGKHITTSKDYEMLRKHFIEAIGIKIECYDLNGNLVKRYDSISQATKDGFSGPTIGSCCNNTHGKFGCIYNYLIWKRQDDLTPIEDILKRIDINEYIKNKPFKKILCFDLNGNLVKTYDNIKQANDNGFMRVGQCCNKIYGNSKCIYKDLIWKFEIDPTPIEELLKYVPIYYQSMMNKAVCAFDFKGNLVKRYESTLEVEKDGYCRSAVSYCCHNQYHKKKCVYKGLIWRFEYDKDSIFDIIKDIDETFVINTNNTTRKPVLCYTLDGELVKEYRSLTSAEKDGFNGHIVSKCCNNEYGELKDVYKNFRWKWKL